MRLCHRHLSWRTRACGRARVVPRCGSAGRRGTTWAARRGGYTGREVRAVLADFGAHGVGRGGVCRACKVCEGQRKVRVVLEVGGKCLSAEVQVVPNRTLDLDLELALVLVWVQERHRQRCSGVRAN